MELAEKRYTQWLAQQGLEPELRQELQFCLDTTRLLLRQAVLHMQKAKRLHDRIELLCRPFVDFAAVDRLTEKTIAQIFG